MAGMESFMWKGTIKWADFIAVAGQVIEKWNSVTRFVTHTDMRERIWTARHESVAQPFILFNEDSLRGSLPREGNPLAVLLLIGMAHAKPGCVEMTFSNGQKIDLMRFEVADMTAMLPQATHPAHRKLAELAVSGFVQNPAGA